MVSLFTAGLAHCVVAAILGAQLVSGSCSGECLEQDSSDNLLMTNVSAHASVQTAHASREAVSLESPSKRLAVLIAGCEDRLIWESKVERIVEPAIQQGFHVDFFMDLVKSGHQDQTVWSPVSGSVAPQVDFKKVKESITAAGARLAYLNMHDRLDVERDFPQTDFVRQHLQGRITLISPFKEESPKRAVGLNFLRRLKATEQFMKRIQQEESQHGAYSFILHAKDDGYWLNSLNMKDFERAGSQNTIFSLSCNQYGGLNDKVFLFGRDAAGKMLANVYTDMFLKEKPLDSGNSEAYWQRLSQLYGVTSSFVPPTALASANSAIQNGHLCQKVWQLCSASYSESPVPCSRSM